MKALNQNSIAYQVFQILKILTRKNKAATITQIHDKLSEIFPSSFLIIKKVCEWLTIKGYAKKKNFRYAAVFEGDEEDFKANKNKIKSKNKIKARKSTKSTKSKARSKRAKRKVKF